MLQYARHLLALFAIALATTLVAGDALAYPEERGRGIPAGVPPELEGVGVDEHLNAPLPLDTPFRDHTGKAVKLRDYFDGKRPVIVNFAYHNCPVLCPLLLNQIEAGMKGVPWTAGVEYQVVTISIDPKETLEKAAARRRSLLADYNRPEAEGGWHFLVGDQASIDAVANAIGYRYRYDKDQGQWAHPSALFIVKPDGTTARYLYGLEFPANDIKLGLFEASQGRSMNTIEQIILYCYHYDPKGGKYVLVANRVMQVGGAATAILIAVFLGAFWIREKKKGGLLAESAPIAETPAASPSK
jgi:protein SCO1/2